VGYFQIGTAITICEETIAVYVQTLTKLGEHAIPAHDCKEDVKD